MALTTRVKRVLNSALAPLNLKLDSRTADRAERSRLDRLIEAGHFEEPIYSLRQTLPSPPEGLVEAIRAGRSRFESFVDAGRNEVGYSFDNSYFTSPDAEVLYAMLRWRRPALYVEIGSGHSTRVARQAVLDGELPTRIVCIDPTPRLSVVGVADEVHPRRVEDRSSQLVFERLQPGDFLFIDSSHEIRPGNDVLHLLLRALPALPDRVLIHVHDVFLPYDYPSDWAAREGAPWLEQYLVAALLGGGSRYRVVWPGYWLQRTWREFGSLFPCSGGRRAQSFWLEVGPEAGSS